MIDLRLGFKIYDNDWFLKHGLAPEQAADLLAEMGTTFVIAQSRLLPMQDSAVESEVREIDGRYQSLDDIAFRNALRERGIAYFGCLNTCFDPALAAAHPELLPIDQFGRIEEKRTGISGCRPTGSRIWITRLRFWSVQCPLLIRMEFIWGSCGGLAFGKHGCRMLIARRCRITATRHRRFGGSAKRRIWICRCKMQSRLHR